MIVGEVAKSFTIQITNDILEFFEEARIYCSERKWNQPRRWRLGDKINIHKETSVEPYVTFRTGMHVLDFGAFSYTGSALPLDIKVGRYCSIAKNVSVMGWAHPSGAVSTSLMICEKNVRWVKQAYKDFGLREFVSVENHQKPMPTIGNDVWVGAGAVLGRGIKVGDGAIIAAGAIVTKDVDPYAIVGGTPAKKIRYRFERSVFEVLLDLQWWNFNFKDIADLDFNSPPVFASQLKERAKGLAPWTPRRINLWDEFTRGR